MTCVSAKRHVHAHVVQEQYKIWRRSLPTNVKAHISNETFDKDTYKQVMEKADNVWLSHKSPASVSSISSAAASQTSTQTSSNSTATTSEDPSSNPSVAAFTQPRGRGRGQGNRGGNRGNRGSNRGNANRGSGRGGQNAQRGRGGQGQGHPVHRGARHASNPPLEVCRTHWIYGGDAKWCEDTYACPWKNFTKPSSQ